MLCARSHSSWYPITPLLPYSLSQDHTNALQLVSKFLSDTFSHSFVDEVHSVGHRVVHGRELSDSMLIT